MDCCAPGAPLASIIHHAASDKNILTSPPPPAPTSQPPQQQPSKRQYQYTGGVTAGTSYSFLSGPPGATGGAAATPLIVFGTTGEFGTSITAGTINTMTAPKSKSNKSKGGHLTHYQKSLRTRAAAIQETRTQKENRKANELLESAVAILKDVDESPLLQTNEIRDFPTFDKSEVQTGPLLGVGGFCNVYEISNFQLKEESKKEEGNGNGSSTTATTTSDDNNKSSSINHPIHVGSSDGVPNSGGGEEIITAATSAAAVTDAIINELEQELGLEDEDPHDDEDDHDDHYDFSIARRHMADNVQRRSKSRNKNESRYAIKKLRSGLGVLERARGTIDLSIEAKFLSVLWHPNIVKMRAVASGPSLDRNFFIIMDRLYQTLDIRIKKDWLVRYSAAKGNVLGFGANKEELNALVVDRLVVAYDLATAFDYMHENQLVYRDVKKENIAFDVRGDVKIFDFGLSKALRPDLKARDSLGRPVYGYNLTPRTGSIPFMAPEIVECKPYDEKCDVFSFAVLLWEILALKPAFKGYNRRDFLERVVRAKQRLPIERSWPPLTRGLIKEAWDDNPQKRPTMNRISCMMKGDLKELSSDPKIQNRDNYMKNRSTHSLRKIMAAKKKAQAQKSKHSKHSC